MTFSTLTVEEKENYGFNVPLRDDEYKSSPPEFAHSNKILIL